MPEASQDPWGEAGCLKQRLKAASEILPSERVPKSNGNVSGAAATARSNATSMIHRMAHRRRRHGAVPADGGA